ncbi:MAG: sugar transferase [Alphaproteobacteria bacterium]
MDWAPIVLFTYFRPEHTRRTIEALKANRGAAQSDLILFSDGPKTPEHAPRVEEVRQYLRTVDGFNSVQIVERDRNWGLANSVIAGVSQLCDERGRCVVMEDDMLSSPNFLEFINAALETYKGRPDIFSATGYNYPLTIPHNFPDDAYLSFRSSSWGWATWDDRWRKVDWQLKDFEAFLEDPEELALFARGGNDLLAMLKLQMQGKLDSWSIRFDYAHYKFDALCLHPIKSKIHNIGFDGSGIHCSVSDEYSVDLDPGDKPFRLDPRMQLNPRMLQSFNQMFRKDSLPGLTPAQVISTLNRANRPARVTLS